MQIFFFIFSFEIVFSIKTEIKFTLNVPSLFRCQTNGPIFYFRTFPSDEVFLQTIKNSTKDCDLILLSAEKRVIFEVVKHRVICEKDFLGVFNRMNEILFFKSNCSINDGIDLCTRFTPTTTTTISDHLIKPNVPLSVDAMISGIGTENIQIGDPEQYPYSWRNSGYEKSGIRIYYVVFKVKNSGYLNMMCQYSYVNNPNAKNTICRLTWWFAKIIAQVRSGPMTSTGDGWSWLCYYYPSGVEQPLDYKMIDKASEDLERTTTTSEPSVLATLPSSNLTEFYNDSAMILDESKKDSSIFIAGFLIVLIIVGGIYCFYKHKSQASNSTRSSLETQVSNSSDDGFDDDDD